MPRTQIQTRQLISSISQEHVWQQTAMAWGYLMISNTLVTFSARDAKTRFGEVLDEALGRPVGITRHDRLTAYVVSKRDFDGLRERVQELEDRLWLIQAEAARKEGFASSSEVDAFLRNVRNIGNESNDDEAGTESLPRS